MLTFVHQVGVRSDGGLNSWAAILRARERDTTVLVANRPSEWTEHVRPSLKGLVTRERGLRLRSIVRAARWAEVVHANDPQSMPIALFVATLTRRPLFFHVRDLKVPGQRYSMKWHVFLRLSTVIVLSQSMKRELLERTSNRLLPDPKIAVCRSGVDLAGFQRAVAIPKSLSPEVLFAASVRPDKGQVEFLREAVPRLARLGVLTRFVGDIVDLESEYTKQFKELLSKCEGEVVFEGHVADMVGAYGQAAATVLPSRREGMARVMLESLAAGTPVISFDVTSAREVIRPSCGHVVPTGDYQELVKCIGDVLTWDVPATREACVRSSQGFSVDASCRAFEDALAGAQIEETE